mmetsp:Transcript_9690/g.24346  ORF Transcript_9690/g.24346 Transcript_9690/m.24346 type:complete len:216 (+) Transcript_9690:1828-2475(+)
MVIMVCRWPGLLAAEEAALPSPGAMEILSVRSMTVALAVPPLSHIVRSPYLPPRRSSSLIKLDMSMAPVAPIGCPRAIAPPFTFTRERSPPTIALAQAKGTEENASFTSIRSKSFTWSPAFASTAFVAGIGPSNITMGSVPERPSAKIRARGRRPRRCKPRSLHTRTAAAPSQICDAAAAVRQPLLRRGFNLLRASRLASGRMPSSTACISSGAG